MKNSLSKNTIIDIGFYGGLITKAINALIEFIGGLLMLIISHDSLDHLIRQIALPELAESSQDTVMNHLITLGQNLSIDTQRTVAIYMLTHGATKLAVIWLLLSKRMWAYPVAVAVFGIFIAYETYSYLSSNSLLILLIIMIDIAIVVLIILEYNRLKAEKASLNGLQ